jgi:hypothetical protein
VLRDETYMRWVEANDVLLKISALPDSRIAKTIETAWRSSWPTSIAALPQDFLCARGVRWLGDKDGMKAVRKLDEQFAAEVLEALQTTNLNEKCAAYAKLLQQSYASRRASVVRSTACRDCRRMVQAFDG